MSKVQLYIGTDLLDFNNKINIKRQVNDYRDPSIGSSVKSFTLEIPLTKKNRPLLGFVGDVRSRVEVSDDARIVVNGVEVIRGKLRILRSTSDQVRAIIEGSDWIDEISGKSIRDIGWDSGEDHSFSATNISASWTAAAGAFYRYPLINFGELVSEGYGGGGSDVYPVDFYPTWNVEDIVTQLFLNAGYTLDTNGFFASAFGRSLYLLSAPDIVKDSFITNKALLVYVDNDTDNHHSFSTGPITAGDVLTVNQTLDIDAEETDDGGDYVAATNIYTIPEDGTYRFQAHIEINSDPHLDAKFTVNSSSISWQIKRDALVAVSASESSVTVFNAGNSFDLDTGYLHFTAGEEILTNINITVDFDTNSATTEDPELNVIAGLTASYFQNVWDEQCLWPGIGNTINPEYYLPDMDSIELLKGLKDAFNLRLWMDRMNKKIYIETSDDFYGSTIIDWSDKIDYSTAPEIEIISGNYKKYQKLKWKPDSGDKAYSNYVSAEGVPFQKEITLDSEYVKAGSSINENPVFGPTIHGEMIQIGHYNYEKIPRIFGGDEFISTIKPYPLNRPKSWVNRILEWKGMVALTNGNWDWLTSFDDTSATNYTTFPSMETPDMGDMYDDYLLKDWNRIEKNRIVTVTLKLTPAEILRFMTVVGTAANEGFRATYKLNIEGVDMLFICSKIITDGDRVKAEFVQKM